MKRIDFGFKHYKYRPVRGTCYCEIAYQQMEDGSLVKSLESPIPKDGLLCHADLYTLENQLEANLPLKEIPLSDMDITPEYALSAMSDSFKIDEPSKD